MEEKERYIIDRFDEDIFDTKKEYYPSNQTICEIINQQDNRIKELEKENKELEIKLDKCGTELVNAESLVSKLKKENKQLKQQLHDLPKKIVGEIKDFAEIQIKNLIKFGYYADERNRGLRPINYYDLMEILNTILKKFGGEND